MGILISRSDSSLDDLVAAAQADPANDSSAMIEILARFEPAVRAVARRVTDDTWLQDDAAQEARIALIAAVRKHTVGTAGFPSYAKQYMKGAALHALISAKPAPEICIEFDAQWTDTTPQPGPVDSTFEVLDILGHLTIDQQAVASAFYLRDVRVTDIAAELGISKPAVTQRLATIHRVLRPVMEIASAA